jgi:hypothetical protein
MLSADRTVAFERVGRVTSTVSHCSMVIYEPSPVLCALPLLGRMGAMSIRYDENTKARAVRLVREHRDDYESEWAAMKAISGRLGMNPETLGGLHLVVEVAGSWPGRRGLLSCRCRSMSASSMVAGMNPNSAVSSRSLFISNIAATSSSRTHRPSGTGELPEGGYVRQRRGTGYQVVRVGRVYQDLLVVVATTPLPRPSLTDHGGALPWRSGR